MGKVKFSREEKWVAFEKALEKLETEGTAITRRTLIQYAADELGAGFSTMDAFLNCDLNSTQQLTVEVWLHVKTFSCASSDHGDQEKGRYLGAINMFLSERPEGEKIPLETLAKRVGRSEVIVGHYLNLHADVARFVEH